MAQTGYYSLAGFGFMTEVFSVATCFIGCRRLLGCNRGFLGGFRVVFLCLSVATRAPHDVATVFCFLL